MWPLLCVTSKYAACQSSGDSEEQLLVTLHWVLWCADQLGVLAGAEGRDRQVRGRPGLW